MSTLDDLQSIQELDKFNKFKDYIKKFILTSENLWKIIYHSTSNPLNEMYDENPYSIFENYSDAKHGVVLFKDKNDVILNSETVNILIKFSSETSNDSDCINTIFIEYSIILKGTNIQTLADSSSRAYKICELIDEQFNHNKITDIGEIKRVSFKSESINEENSSFKLIYKCVVTNYNDAIQVYRHNKEEDEYGITREKYFMFSPTEPILADIQPYSSSKTKQTYGYSTETTRKMFCNIIPEINESSIIKYDNQYYRIQKLVEYDDFMDCELVVIWNRVLIESLLYSQLSNDIYKEIEFK